MVMPIPLAAIKRTAGTFHLLLALLAGLSLAASTGAAYAQDSTGGAAGVEERADDAFTELEDLTGLSDRADEAEGAAWHKVREGETLATIATRHYGTALLWWRIAEANDIDDPRSLEVGRKLLIPAVPETPEVAERDATDRYHIVVEGDTLGRISNRYYGTTNHWRTLARVNGIERNNWIRVGQLLLIPELDADGNVVEEHPANRPALPALDVPADSSSRPADLDAVAVGPDHDARATDAQPEGPEPIEPEYPGYYGTSGDLRDRSGDDGYLPPDERDDARRDADSQPRAHPRHTGDAYDDVETEDEAPPRHEWGWVTFGVDFRNITTYWGRNYGFDTLGFTFDTGLLIAGGNPTQSYSRNDIGDWGLYFLLNIQADIDVESGDLARIGGSLGLFIKIDRFELIWRENAFFFDDRASGAPMPADEEFFGQIFVRFRLPIFGNSTFFGVDIRHRYIDTDDDFYKYGIYWDVWEGAGWRFGFVAFGHDPYQLGLGSLLPEKVVFNLAADDPDFGSRWTDIEIVWGVNLILGGRSTLAPTGGAWVMRFEVAWRLDLGPSTDELRWATSISYTFF